MPYLTATTTTSNPHKPHHSPYLFSSDSRQPQPQRATFALCLPKILSHTPVHTVDAPMALVPWQQQQQQQQQKQQQQQQQSHSLAFATTCRMAKSSRISSLPPGIALARTSRYMHKRVKMCTQSQNTHNVTVFHCGRQGFDVQSFDNFARALLDDG